jgi:hypothetical protein
MARGWLIAALRVIAALCSVACARQASVTPPPASTPESPVVVESEPEAAPIENTAEALIAAAEKITRVELCHPQTGEPLATLPPATLEKLRKVLRDGGIKEGLSTEPAWEIILRVEVEGQREPFIVQFVGTALRVKPVDPWSFTIADESGQIDWRIQEIYVDYELEFELAIVEALPPATEVEPADPDRRKATPDDFPNQPPG